MKMIDRDPKEIEQIYRESGVAGVMDQYSITAQGARQLLKRRCGIDSIAEENRKKLLSVYSAGGVEAVMRHYKINRSSAHRRLNRIDIKLNRVAVATCDIVIAFNAGGIAEVMKRHNIAIQTAITYAREAGISRAEISRTTQYTDPPPDFCQQADKMTISRLAIRYLVTHEQICRWGEMAYGVRSSWRDWTGEFNMGMEAEQ